MVNRLLLITIILFSTTLVSAQFQSVQYDYEKNWFGENQKLPAETPWMLSGQLPENISSIAVEIFGSSDRNKVPLHRAVWSAPLDGEPTNFYIPVNYNLRSNSSYTIELKYYRSMRPLEKDNLTQDVYDAIRSYIELNIVASKNEARLNKNPKAMIKDLDKLMNDGLVLFRSDLNRDFPGFSQLVLDQLESMDKLKLKQGKFNILQKKDDTSVADQKIEYFQTQLENLQQVIKREIDQYMSYHLSVLEISRVVDNYYTEKTRNVIPINVGYGAVHNKGGIDNNMDYDSSPFIGVSFPLANPNFAGRFWSNSSISVGVFLNDFKFDNGDKYTGPLIERPFYLAYGYKVAYFIRLNAGATLLENVDGGGGVFVRPFVGVSIEINTWMGLGGK